MSDQDTQILGRLLSAERTRKRFSKQSLAKAANLSATYIANIEAGRDPSGKPANPTVQTLRKLADALGDGDEVEAERIYIAMMNAAGGRQDSRPLRRIPVQPQIIPPAAPSQLSPTSSGDRDNVVDDQSEVGCLDAPGQEDAGRRGASGHNAEGLLGDDSEAISGAFGENNACGIEITDDSGGLSEIRGTSDLNMPQPDRMTDAVPPIWILLNDPRLRAHCYAILANWDRFSIEDQTLVLDFMEFVNTRRNSRQ